jgi:phage tail protein X
MQTVTAHQYETLDDVLYRITGNTAPIAQVMAANPHALRSPRLAGGTPVHIPRAPVAKPAPTVKLWE